MVIPPSSELRKRVSSLTSSLTIYGGSVHRERVYKDADAAGKFFLESLKFCAKRRDLHQGCSLHAALCTNGLLQKDPCIGSALVNMYARCGALAKAQQVHIEIPYRDVVTWSALIGGCVQQGEGNAALDCYSQMQSEGFHPNEVTYSMLLKACAINRDIHKGTQIHDEILRVGLSGKHAVLDTALVDMYAKCGNLWKAQEVFDELIARDLISWAVLLAGYVHHGKGVEALERYKRMKVEGLSPNAFIYAVILKACGITREIYKGKHIHDEIISHQLLGSDIVLGTALIDMYSKCGLPNKAHGVLEELPFCNLVSWNSLIGGYAHLCEIDEAFHCFQQMQHEGIFPNEVTFISMLHACRHSGLENEGELVYVNMKTTYGIKPNLRHHIYMIDILSHAGHFEKAMATIEEMQTSDYLPIWSSILGACLKWGNLRVGRLAFEHAISLDKSNAAAYSCMEKIYITAGMYEEARKIRDMMANNMLF